MRALKARVPGHRKIGTSVASLVFVSLLLLAAAACGKSSDSGAGSGSTVAPVAAGAVVNGSPTFDKMKSRGKVIIGVKEDQPNLGYKDPTTGQYSGFDIEMAKLMAAQLGFAPDKIEFKAIPTPNREQALVNGDIDYYVGTYSITDKRKEQIGFSGPYYIAGQDLLVRKDDTSITGPDSLTGKKVCSVTGSTPIQRIKDEHPEATVIEFEKYSQCVDAVLNGQADALTTDDAILKGYAAQNPDKLNELITAAEQNGTWKTIYDSTLGKSGAPGTPPPVEPY